MDKKPRILHILTGGTIVGCVPEYPEVGRLAGIFTDTSDIDKYVSQSLKTAAHFSVEEICKKDSREITKEDRNQILEVIKKYFSEGFRHFLITHGTYTMPETGIFLIDNLPDEILDQSSIIITGSMYPMNFIGSDALMNVGAAVSALVNSTEPLGVKVNMHAKNWDPRRIKKDAENLIFEEA